MRVSQRLVLVPHKRGSRSARALADVLSERLGYRVKRMSPDYAGSNPAFRFTHGTDKLTQFRRFHESGVSCPEFTVNRADCLAWLAAGDAVVCRTLLRGSQGDGIVVAETEGELVDAPLYTKYTKKKQEYRVHVFNGRVIDVQEKRKKSDFTEQRDTRIRNLANGYVFCRDGIRVPDGLEDLSLRAVQALGYSMGACDIIFNSHHNRLYVLEVNSTPGMEGTTVQKYADAILEQYRAL